MKRALSVANLILFALFGSQLSAQWVKTNGPLGGAACSFALRDNLVYAAVGGEVFVSSDTGRSWQSISDGLASGANTIVRRGTDLLAAGGRGVFRLPLNSSTWLNSSAGLPESCGTHAFAMDDDHVYLGSSIGVFMSTDNGGSWVAANYGLTSSIRTMGLSGENLFVGLGGMGTFRSTDQGRSWIQKTNGPMDTWVADFVFSGSGIYAGTGMGLFYSGNNGDYWCRMRSGLPNASIGGLTICGSNLFVGTYDKGTVYRTTDGGASWQEAWHGSDNANDIMLNLQNLDGLLFAGMEGTGVVVSVDSGLTWSARNTGLAKTQVISLFGDGETILAGTHFAGLFVSTNKGDTWMRPTSGLSAFDVTCFAKSDGKTWAGTNVGLYLSTNNGSAWTRVYNGLGSFSGVYSLVFEGPNGFGAFSPDGIYRTTDGGASWIASNRGLESMVAHSIAVLAPNVFVATERGVFRSTDDGSNWTQVNYGLLDTNITCLVAQGQRLFAGTTLGSIYVSNDHGLSWLPASSGITPTYVTNMVASESGLFASLAQGGVFYSSNMGRSWVPASTGLKEGWVQGLCVSGTELYAGILGNGVWRRPLSEIATFVPPSPGDMPTAFVLNQNYPNPFNPTTTIRYALAQTAKVTLKVYDVLGQEIETLVDQMKCAGVYEMKFDGSNLSSGVYLYRMEAGSTVSTKKLVLVK